MVQKKESTKGSPSVAKLECSTAVPKVDQRVVPRAPQWVALTAVDLAVK